MKGEKGWLNKLKRVILIKIENSRKISKQFYEIFCLVPSSILLPSRVQFILLLDSVSETESISNFSYLKIKKVLRRKTTDNMTHSSRTTDKDIMNKLN